MNRHLTGAELDLLVDGEGLVEIRPELEAHLIACQQCAASMVPSLHLKRLTAEAGLRYHPSPDFARRILAVTAPRQTRRYWLPVFATAAACLLLAVLFFTTRKPAPQQALSRELLDQHIAMLSARSQPQILSSNKHVVRPWFQGKLPFTFNTPDTLPPETELIGANLSYLQGKPVGDLIFKIRQHYVSVFLSQRDSSSVLEPPKGDAGFHIRAASTPHLDVIAVSDVVNPDLDALLASITAAQDP